MSHYLTPPHFSFCCQFVFSSKLQTCALCFFFFTYFSLVLTMCPLRALINILSVKDRRWAWARQCNFGPPLLLCMQNVCEKCTFFPAKCVWKVCIFSFHLRVCNQPQQRGIFLTEQVKDNLHHKSAFLGEQKREDVSLGQAGKGGNIFQNPLLSS